MVVLCVIKQPRLDRLSDLEFHGLGGLAAHFEAGYVDLLPVHDYGGLGFDLSLFHKLVQRESYEFVFAVVTVLFMGHRRNIFDLVRHEANVEAGRGHDVKSVGVVDHIGMLTEHFLVGEMQLDRMSSLLARIGCVTTSALSSDTN